MSSWRPAVRFLPASHIAGSRNGVAAKKKRSLSAFFRPTASSRLQRADFHFLISKSGADRVSTSVEQLDPPARQEEIARMLAGVMITDEARAVAERLMREKA